MYISNLIQILANLLPFLKWGYISGYVNCKP